MCFVAVSDIGLSYCWAGGQTSSRPQGFSLSRCRISGYGRFRRRKSALRRPTMRGLRMRQEIIAKTLLGATGIMLVGAMAAFLLYVSLLTVTTVSLVLLALILMFALGVQAGGRRIRIKRPKTLSAGFAATKTPSAFKTI